MRYFNKLMVFFVLMLFGYGVDTFGYTYRITNKTGGDVKVQLRYAFGKLGYARIIESGGKHKFSFTFPDSRFGFCLDGIKVSTKDSAGEWGKQKKVSVRVHTGFDYGKINMSVGLCYGANFVLEMVSGEIVATKL